MTSINLRRVLFSDQHPPLVCPTVNTQSIRYTEVIFVLDTSGSMWWAWSPLAESVNSFSTRYTNQHLSTTVIQYARNVSVTSSYNSSYVPLRQDFKYPSLDQSRDDIFLAFSTVKKHIQERRAMASHDLHFCICFVADGGDTESGSNLLHRLSQLESDSSFVQNVSFTTIACGSCFPTNTSIKLRSLFHHDEIVGVPLLTPVSNQPCDLEARFIEVIPHLLGESSRMVKVDPPVKHLPWSDQTVSRVSQGSWFPFNSTDVDSVRLDGARVVIQDHECRLEDLMAIGSQWVRYLQTLAAKGHEDVRTQSQHALSHFSKMHDYVIDSTRDEQNTASEMNSSRTLFERRLQIKKGKTVMYKARTIMNELKSLATNALDDLTDEQLAQRLAIGTKESKYLDKAIRWKGALTVEGFFEAVSHFKKLYTSLLPKLQACAGKDPFRSNVSLESNVDILTDKFFLDNLSDPVISSQFMLIECFPIVGLGLNTYISDGATINPWLVRVDSVSRIVSCVDTASVYAMTENSTSARISAGADEYEEVSAVCPLLVPETADAMGPILRSKLYQIVMTFQVTRNMDTVDKAAHLALLASLLTHLVHQPKSGWRDELLDTVVFTASVLLDNGSAASSKDQVSMEKLTFVELLQRKPNIALVTAHPELPKKCESLSKALLAFAVLLRDKTSNDTTCLRVWERVVAEYIGRALQAVDPDRNWDKWFALTDAAFQGNLNLQNVLGCQGASDVAMSRFASVPDARRFVERFEVKDDDYEVTFSGLRFQVDLVKKARATSNGPVRWDNLTGFEAHFVDDFGITDDELKLRSFVAHTLKHSGSYERAIHEVQPWDETIEKFVTAHLVKSAESRGIREMKKELVLSAQDRMRALMRTAHEKGIVLPLTAQQIGRERKNRYGVETTEEDLKKLRYDEETGLCRAACQNNCCWRFLIADKNFSEHLANSSTEGGRPMIAFHRTVQRLYKDSPGTIEENVLSGRWACREHEFVQSFNRENFSEQARKLLVKIRAAYREFEKQKSNK